MLALQRLGAAALQSAVQRQQARSLMVLPPRIKVSFAEKVAHGVAIAVGVTFIPIWVIVHLEDYKHKQ